MLHKFRLDINEKFFTQRMVRARLPREVVMASRLSELKEHLNNTLSQVV